MENTPAGDVQRPSSWSQLRDDMLTNELRDALASDWRTAHLALSIYTDGRVAHVEGEVSSEPDGCLACPCSFLTSRPRCRRPNSRTVDGHPDFQILLPAASWRPALATTRHRVFRRYRLCRPATAQRWDHYRTPANRPLVLLERSRTSPAWRGYRKRSSNNLLCEITIGV